MLPCALCRPLIANRVDADPNRPTAQLDTRPDAPSPALAYAAGAVVLSLVSLALSLGALLIGGRL